MNIYLITHKNHAINAFNLESWAEIDKIGENVIYVRAVKAYLKKKDAKEYIKKHGYDHLQITTFDNN